MKLAHQRKLPTDATGGSIATVTNFGTFGLTWATPIPLPEQTLVLGMGAGRRVPSWDETKGQFVPVTEANLTLSFDHRVLDGGAAGRLLSRVADLMARPDQLSRAFDCPNLRVNLLLTRRRTCSLLGNRPVKAQRVVCGLQVLEEDRAGR